MTTGLTPRMFGQVTVTRTRISAGLAFDPSHGPLVADFETQVSSRTVV